VLVSEQNKSIVCRLVDEVMNAGRLDVLDEIYSPCGVPEVGLSL
jgi:hypothetical protein